MKNQPGSMNAMRAKVKEQKTLIAIYEQENQHLRDKNHALDARAKLATEELVDLAQGIGVKPDWYNATTHGWDCAMKHKAGLAVKKISGMRLP